MRYKGVVEKLEAKVQEDPYNFFLDEATLPSSVLNNLSFFAKLKERLAALAEKLRTEHGGAVCLEVPATTLKAGHWQHGAKVSV